MRQSGKIVLLFFAAALVFTEVSYAATTQEKIQETQRKKEELQNQLEQTQGQIQGMEETREGLKQVLDQLNGDLAKIGQKLSELEEQIRDKEEEISETKEELEDAKEQVARQYEMMKARIRFVYEKGKPSYLDALLQAKNFVDFLNRAEYTEKVSEYDHKMLEKLKALKEDVERHEAALEQENRELNELREDVKAQQKKVGQRVNSTSADINLYQAGISNAEAIALQQEAEIDRAQNELTQLLIQYEKEKEIARQAAMMQKKDISELSIDASDLDLLAALIEAEAGGESYEGKIAVGAVVMNRARSGVFPDTIPGVIFQNRQFSPVASGRFAMILARGASSSCYQAAQEAMAGASNVGDCLFFRTVIPEIQGIIIGNHVFY